MKENSVIINEIHSLLNPTFLFKKMNDLALMNVLPINDSNIQYVLIKNVNIRLRYYQ